MRGRKPKPNAQQIAEGDPSKRGIVKLHARLSGEPEATKGIPACPKHLKGRARAAWNFWAPELSAMGIDRLPDAMMLEGACVGYSQAVQADLILAKEGPICTHHTADPQTGEPMVKLRAHPAVSISRSAWTQVRSFCSEFGLSPVSRTRLSAADPAGKEDDLAAMLNAPRADRNLAIQ